MLKRQRGQSLVEFVVILPLLLIMLSGLLDLGRLYFAYVAVTDVAGEGAGYAAAYLPPGGGRCPDTDQMRTEEASGGGCLNHAQPLTNTAPADYRHLYCTCWRAYAATTGLVEGDELGVAVAVPSGTTFGSYITVTVDYTHTLLTPIVNVIVPQGTLPLRAYATERVVDPSTE
jgi:hypothetical protein